MRKKPFSLLIIFVITILVIVSVALFLNRGFIVSKIVEKSFLRAGRPLKFGDYTVVIDRIEGNKLFGIKMNESNRKFEAKSGNGDGGHEYHTGLNLILFANYFKGLRRPGPVSQYGVNSSRSPALYFCVR